ncbi:hypothetical protein OG21DRAFT_1488646 [Imleria badia]|nr:hypothetical protein OG21DRAFT_1488646 [Imleria badia]
MNGNYDLYAHSSTGYVANPSISDGMPNSDQALYGCGGSGGAPLYPQASVGYNNQYAQQIYSLNEHCKALENQLVKVTTERDTLRTMLDQLSASLQNQKIASAATAPVKTAEMYPNVRFWTQKQYNEWTNSAEAHADCHYKIAFLEDEQGAVVSDATLKAIRKKICGCWAELVDKNMAPKSWGKATTSTKEFVHATIYKSYPILQLAENDWKLELLCSGDYPGWVRNNLDSQGKWQVKQEDDTPTGQESGMRKKRKAGQVDYIV